jgi:hypothetical protein
MTKPKTADGYTPEHLAQVRAICLHLASILGDMLDNLVVVGGLVPSLLIDAGRVGGELHVGTTDLDVGLEIVLLDSGRYHTLAERLRGSEFEPDKTEEGNVVRQRWRHKGSTATIDFLMPPAREGARGGSLQDLERDLAALVTPGLQLAFRDRKHVRMEGRTLHGEKLARDIPVCGVGAFVILKALAFHQRGENKDAYDLYYVLRYYGTTVEDVAARLRVLMSAPDAQRAISHLREDYADVDSTGPVRAAAFLGRSEDEGFRADVVGLVNRLIGAL